MNYALFENSVIFNDRQDVFGIDMIGGDAPREANTKGYHQNIQWLVVIAVSVGVAKCQNW